MGCPVIVEFAYLYPHRLERAILVSPAGGMHNQPFLEPYGSSATTALREPVRLLRVAVPDYLRFGVPSTFRMFRSLTQFPSLDRLLALDVPTLVVAGTRDPLTAGPARIREVAERVEHRVVFVAIDGAAHAINFSHPGELANVIRQFMADKPIVDDPDSPGNARAFEIYRGKYAPQISDPQP